MECQEARELMSDYFEQYLAEPEAGLLAEHLADCGECQSELAELEKTLSVVHGLPRQAPISDLWPEFAPKFAEIRAEMQISLLERIRLYFVRLFDAIAEGWAIFVTTVRMTYARKERLT
jgi:predicted anti-sigma-YlaC factor YlaD